MRILLVSHHRQYKVREPWRVEGFARALQRRGHELTILCVADRERWRTQERTERGIRFIASPDLLWGRMRSGWDPWCAWHRTRTLRRLDYDLVHTFETRPATVHPLLAQLRRRPAPLVIDWTDWWGRGGLITENRPRWYQLLFGGVETYYEEHYRTRAGATTVIAQGLADRAAKLGVPPQSIFRIPNGCRPEAVKVVGPRAHRADFGLPADRFIVGASALDVKIGLDLAVDAIAVAARARPDVLLMLTGSAADALAERARAAGLGEYVRSLGIVPAAKYEAALSCADIFFVPFLDRVANYGRWPGRVNDYLALGRPIITQPVGEMKLLLESEPVGFLSDETPAGIGAAIVAARDQPERCAAFGAHARRLAETTLSWDALAPRIEEAYAYAAAVFSRPHAKEVAAGSPRP